MKQKNVAISLPSTGDEEWLAVKDPILSGWLTQGPKVAEFERSFASVHQVNYALATTSCTTALHLILLAMDIGPGDEVIVPAFTWVATANVVLYCGATPVFVDVDKYTNNICLKALANKISNKTKAVIVVHLFGLCVDVEAIKEVVPDSVRIIEDAACAAGAMLENRFSGGLGDAAAFSFHPRKTITTGEGGMVTTNDQGLAEKMMKLRNHGAEVSEEQRHQGPKPYLLPEFNLLGFNYRMTDVQGAIGLVQLAKLSSFIEQRQQWATFYKQQLADIDWIQLPVFPQTGQHAWQAFVIHVLPDKAPMERNSIMEFMQSKGIATRPGTHALHTLNYYKQRYGFDDRDFPNALFCHNQTMAIPLHNRMDVDDYQYVVDTLRALC